MFNKMNRSSSRLLQATALCAAVVMPASLAHADGPRVVASIKPLHAIASAVMDGVGTPVLLLEGNASPHGATLKPSAARALADAQAVFWVGPPLEAFMVKPLASLAKKVEATPLMDAPGMTILKSRGGHHHHDEEEHAHEHEKDGAEHKHEHDKHEAEREHDKHEAEHDHDHAVGGPDPHMWLDPENAIAMGNAMAAELAHVDPAHADTYKKNAARLSAALTALTQDLKAELAPVKDRPFLVAHDSFQYFQNRFGLTGQGILSINPEITPSAKQIAEIREEVKEHGVVCVFREPQMSPKIADVVREGSDAKVGLLDPLGRDIADGPNAYAELIRFNAKAMLDCLRP